MAPESDSESDEKMLKAKVGKSTQEKRLSRFRSQCPAKLHDRLHRANTQRMYLINQSDSPSSPGCIFSVLGSTGNVYEVRLQHVSTCSCPDFARQKDLCKHIIFVLIKVIGLSPDNPLAFQKAYLTSELEELSEMMRNRRVGGSRDSILANEEVRTSYTRMLASGKSEDTNDDGDTKSNHIQRRSIEGEEDWDCPICFDRMDCNDKKNELTFCRGTCGSNFHHDCIVKWLKNCSTKSCPNCRQPWIGEENESNPKGKTKINPDSSYVNFATLQGMSTVRDTSTYSSYSPASKRRRY